jgi:hypothetical protein
VPIASRSVIHPTVNVVSVRKHAAKATFTESPFGPSFEISFLRKRAVNPMVPNLFSARRQ